MPPGTNYLIGQVVMRGIKQPDSVKVRTLRMVLDKYLKKYFNKKKDYWVCDKKVTSNVGDIVLIKELTERLTPEVKHEVHEMVFELGKVVDPVTGRRCRGRDFIDEAAREAEIKKFGTEVR
ncbi:hypothetical protein ScPMuIL_000297 [Solemya velum]